MNMHSLFSGITLSFICLNGFAQTIQSDVPENTIRHFQPSIQWKQNIPGLPKGTEMAVLEGNPKSEGLFTLRLKAPAFMTLPVHSHPTHERVTVLDGKIYVGFGDTFDEAVSTAFSPGDYYVNPPQAFHYVYTKSEGAVVQITGMGPWQVILKDAK